LLGLDPTGSGRTEHRLEAAIGRFLTIGTYATIAVLGLGVLSMLVVGRSPLDAALPLDLARLPSDLAALRPEGLLWLGLLLVMATPSLRVVVALVGFARGGERRMALVAVGVLLVIVAGVVLARITDV